MEEVKKQMEENGDNAVVLLSYNPIQGFPSGVYGGGRVISYCWDRSLQSEGCKSVAKDITDQFYNDFNLRKDSDIIEHIFVYSGINAIDESIQAARMIGHDLKGYENGERVTLVACDCDVDKKRKEAHESYSIRMILSECGGKKTMGRIGNLILEGTPPREISDYAK